MERKHTPVHAVGTITLGCVFLGDVCKGTQNSLAGSSLLTGRTIARLICVDGGTNLNFLSLDILLTRNGGDHLHNLCDLSVYSTCKTLLLHSLNCLRTANILRITSGQGKLSQS